MNKISQYLGRLLGLALVVLTLSSCGSVASRSGGLNDEAYILVTSGRVFKGEYVLVHIDDLPAQEVKARREGNKAVRRGERLAITPGRHRVAVVDRLGQLLYDKEIFISSRSTKTITIP